MPKGRYPRFAINTGRHHDGEVRRLGYSPVDVGTAANADRRAFDQRGEPKRLDALDLGPHQRDDIRCLRLRIARFVPGAESTKTCSCGSIFPSSPALFGPSVVINCATPSSLPPSAPSARKRATSHGVLHLFSDGSNGVPSSTGIMTSMYQTLLLRMLRMTQSFM